MSESLVFTKDALGFEKEFNSATGMVGRDLRARARKVERAAKVQVGKDTRNLHRLIRTDVHPGPLGPTAEVGVTVEPLIGYAYFHHEGTRPHIIAAKPGQHLRFRGRGGAMVTVTSVRHPGTKPNKYLSDNLYLAVL
jgi:hypothetical protein